MPLVVRMVGACDWQGGVFRHGAFDQGVPARLLTVTAGPDDAVIYVRTS
jgi:hypothetical protein